MAKGCFHDDLRSQSRGPTVNTRAVEFMLYHCSLAILHCLPTLLLANISDHCRVRKIKQPPCTPHYCLSHPTTFPVFKPS